jgi:hypothetical protein
MSTSCVLCGTNICGRAFSPARFGIRLKAQIVTGAALRIGSGAVAAICLSCGLAYDRARRTRRATVTSIIGFLILLTAGLHWQLVRDVAQTGFAPLRQFFSHTSTQSLPAMPQLAENPDALNAMLCGTAIAVPRSAIGCGLR